MADLGLQGRIEQFSNDYLNRDNIKLDQVGQDRFNALLHDLNYTRSPIQEMFTRVKGYEVEVLMKDNPFNQERGTLSYIVMKNPSELMTFAREYSRLWENTVREEVGVNSVIGGFIGCVVGGICDLMVAGPIGCFQDDITCSSWPYLVAGAVTTVAGGVAGYFWAERSNRKKEKVIKAFVAKYNPRPIAVGRDAYKAALTLPEIQPVTPS